MFIGEQWKGEQLLRGWKIHPDSQVVRGNINVRLVNVMNQTLE